MKIYSYLLFLSLAFIAVNILAMEDTEPETIASENTEIASSIKLKQPLHLKTIASKNLIKFIKNNQLTETELSKLPAELKELSDVIKKADRILDNIFTKYTNTIEKSEQISENIDENKELSALISEFHDLLNQVIDSRSPLTPLCINAIDQYSNHQNELLLDQGIFIEYMNVVILILNIFLEPEKIENFIANKITSLSTPRETMQTFIYQLVNNDLTFLIELLLKMNIFSAEEIYGLLFHICMIIECSPEMVKIIIDNALMSKEVIEYIIKKEILQIWMNKDIESIKLLFDRIELLKLDVKEIVNCNKYYCWETLLNKEISSNRLETVELLLSKKANPSISDALYWSINAHAEIIKLLLLKEADPSDHSLLPYYMINYKESSSCEKLHDELATCTNIRRLVLEALLLNRNEAKE